MAKLTKISFKQLESNNDTSVWVMNSTKPKGRIHINVREPNGTAILVTVENTWIPQDLTTACTREAVMSSSDFRSLVNKGAISIVDHKEAETFMKDPEAIKEHNRLNALMGSGGDYVEISDEDRRSTQQQQERNANGGGSSEPSLSVMSLIGAEEKEGEEGSGIDEEATMSRLRTMQDELTAVDLRHIVQGSRFPKVKALAAEMLAELQAA